MLNSFMIRIGHTGQYLDCENGHFEPGTRVLQYVRHGGANQQFQLNEDSTISPAGHPEVVFDICGGSSAGNHIALYPKHGGENQKFRLKNGRIVNDSGLILEVEGASGDPGARVVAAHKEGKHQHFEIEHLPKVFLIKNVNSGLYLDCEAGHFEPGTRVLQYVKTGGANQHFMLNEDNTISPVGHPEVVFDISGGAVAGGVIALYPKHGGVNQKFRFQGPFIVNDSGLVLDIPSASHEPGVQALVSTKGGAPSQRWQMEQLPRSFMIKCSHSGQYFDAEGGNFAAGSRVLQYVKHGGANQLWQFNDDKTISPAGHPEVVLDITGGAAPGNGLCLYSKHGGINQKFRVDGDHIVNDSGLVLEISGGSQDPGVPVTAAHKIKNEHQQFFLEPTSGLFMIKNENSGHYFDCERGKFEPGTRILQYMKHGGANQLFTFNGDGTISPLGHNELVLDISGGSAPGNMLVLYPKNGGDNQKFYVEGTHLMNVSGLALDVENSSKDPEARIVAWHKNDGPSQRFVLEPIKGPFFIKAVHSGHFLDCEGGRFDPETRVLQYVKHGGANQLWQLNGDGTISPFGHPKVVLDIKDGPTAGNLLILYSKHGGANQKFHFDGKFIVNDSGLVLDIQGGSTDPGTPVASWTKHGGANQQFEFEYIVNPSSLSLVLLGEKH